VSSALRNTIRARGLTAYATAKQAGVSVDAVQRFLNDERGLTLATVDKLAVALELTLCPEGPAPEPTRSGPATPARPRRRGGRDDRKPDPRSR
jgi:transcriptional regulator with XRE-family HTH domain